ncbi:BMP family lipoprotein [Jeotgalibacillus marinus]|uniref:BMP family ABC transporter substrate-binding protein n=1 Tax=Jeotgalibacillus marinus TaxID=86667 RepID=A0ABV3Q1S1_9BACL
MKKMVSTLITLSLLIFLSGCNAFQQQQAEGTTFDAKVGIVLSDTGLGDGSFSDAAFQGLERARNDLNILFDYREAPDGNFEEKLNELVAQDMSLVIGLGFTAQEAIEKVATENPDQQFLLIDGFSEVENVISMTFKEQEGSFLVGLVAALTSNSEIIGFIGGIDEPLIHRFEAGYIAGATFANPEIEVLVDYVGDFGDADLGEEIASKQAASGADFIYPAAGYSGVGAILKAQELGIYAAGVDSDQFFVAEGAVVTSMIKNMDVAVYNLVNSLVEGSIENEDYDLGLAQNGVGLADIRLIDLDMNGQALIQDGRNKIISGEIIVPDKKN